MGWATLPTPKLRPPVSASAIGLPGGVSASPTITTSESATPGAAVTTTIALPGATPVTSPVLETLATLVARLVQVASEGDSGFPAVSVMAAARRERRVLRRDGHDAARADLTRPDIAHRHRHERGCARAAHHHRVDPCVQHSAIARADALERHLERLRSPDDYDRHGEGRVARRIDRHGRICDRPGGAGARDRHDDHV